MGKVSRVNPGRNPKLESLTLYLLEDFTAVQEANIGAKPEICHMRHKNKHFKIKKFPPLYLRRSADKELKAQKI